MAAHFSILAWRIPWTEEGLKESGMPELLTLLLYWQNRTQKAESRFHEYKGDRKKERVKKKPRGGRGAPSMEHKHSSVIAWWGGNGMVTGVSERICYCSWQLRRVWCHAWECLFGKLATSHLFYKPLFFYIPQTPQFLRGWALPCKTINPIDSLLTFTPSNLWTAALGFASVPGWGHTAVFTPMNFHKGHALPPRHTGIPGSVAQTVWSQRGPAPSWRGSQPNCPRIYRPLRTWTLLTPFLPFFGSNSEIISQLKFFSSSFIEI